ncbi:MAG TPA: hypothetical protein VFZ98_07430, partial [Vicinamibacterales bacterium]
MMRLAIALGYLVLTGQAQTTPSPVQSPSADEQALRTTIQQYFDALKARDPDAAASFWSTAANPRMTRDTFVALFGPPADDTYVVEIRSVAINVAEARVRVAVSRVRLETRDG